jgi:putative DNA methylase
MITKKKLIEVALPLEAINKASAREKSIRHGHPSTLHLWWARRPLAAARAVIFAQMVDDPSSLPDLFPTEKKQQKERERLFRIIEDLVLWENTTNERVLQAARDEIWQSWRRACAENADHPRAKELFDRKVLPAFHDPFAGGGALPLEAQRLGLEAFASDLNPVAVLINKAMIEIPARFAGLAPVNLESRKQWLGNREEEEGNREIREEEVGNRDALSGIDGLAKGDRCGKGSLPVGSDASPGGDLRNALADYTGGDVGSSEYRRRMESGVEQGEGTVPGDRAGLPGGNGDLSHPMRGDWLVSKGGDGTVAGFTKRSRKNADDTASQLPQQSLASISNFLPPVTWKGAQGLAEDVRYYGQWMRDEAEKRIGHLYPKVRAWRDPKSGRYFGEAEVDEWRRSEGRAERSESGEEAAHACGHPSLFSLLSTLSSDELTVIAWLWARTVKSPNPAFANVDVPLASTFMLSTKEGKEAYVEVVREEERGERGDASPPSHSSPLPPHPYRFAVRIGKPPDEEKAKNGTKLSRGANFQCVMSGTPIAPTYIKDEGKAGRMGARLMAIVAEGKRGRVYLAATPEHEAVALKAKPEWRPESSLPDDPRNFWTVDYGLKTYGDLFTPRQLVALTTFSDLVSEAMEQVRRDALGARASGPHAPDSNPLPDHQGWHSRGYHPHFDQPGLLQSINFRLHDSVPASLLEQWREELRHHDQQSEEADELRRRIEEYEDQGHGQCYLRDPRVAALVENALLHFDGERYRLIDWCVMPNHVHVLIETREGHPLSSVVGSWKSFTAHEANHLLGREGAFWMPDYYDRFIRDEAHLSAVQRYIRNNPVKAGLCATAEEWVWGSARRMRAGGPRTQWALSIGHPLRWQQCLSVALNTEILATLRVCDGMRICINGHYANFRMYSINIAGRVLVDTLYNRNGYQVIY